MSISILCRASHNNHAVDKKIAIVKFGVKNGRGRGRIMLGFWSVLVEHYKKSLKLQESSTTKRKARLEILDQLKL